MGEAANHMIPGITWPGRVFPRRGFTINRGQCAAEVLVHYDGLNLVESLLRKNLLHIRK